MKNEQRKARILWVGNWRVKGGISIVTEHFMSDPLIQERYQVQVQDQSFAGMWNEQPILKALKLPRGIILILWNCLRFRPDIVHIHTPYQVGFLKDGIMALLARGLGRKVVLTFHPGNSLVEEYHNSPGWLKALTDYVLPRCDALITLGKTYQDFLRQRYPQPLVALIPNPVADEPAARAPRDYEQRGPLVFFAGLFNERKGAFDLLQAVDRVQDPSARFIIQGTPPTPGDQATFERLYAACQNKDRIELHPWGPVFEQLYRARVLVLPSHGESLPIILAEAIACGLPVITTPVGVIPDYVNEGVQGLLIQPGDVDGLARAIETVLARPEWAAQVARANAEYGQIFLRSRVHAALIEIYERLLAQA